MAEFDRIDGVFVATRCTLAEKGLFQRAGWAVDPKLRRWATVEPERAIPLLAHAVGSAKTYIENAVLIRDAAMQASWAETTDKQYPAPEGKVYMDFQRAGIEYALTRTRTLIADAPGLGKAQPIDEPVLTPQGWIEIGKLHVGDFVIGSNGTPTAVTGVFPQGVKPTYLVEFRDGASTRCNGEHLWAVRDGNARVRGKAYSVKTLKELIGRGIKNGDGKNKWDIPLVAPVEYAERKFVIQPYTLGALLGDGSLAESSPQISIPSTKHEVYDRVSLELPDGFRLNLHKGTNCPQYSLSREMSGPTKSAVIEELKRLNLRVTGDLKHIPQEYMLSSGEQRIALLNGLMDTDGSSSENRVCFHSTCYQLALDVQQLVWSLGGSAILRTYDRTKKGKPVEYQLNVKMNTICPFTVAYKKAQWWPSAKNGPMRFIQEVSYVGDREQVCISVAAEDHLYVTKDFTVTHNTIQAIGVHNATATKRILIVCPASLKVNWEREWRAWDVHERSVGIAKSVLESEPVFDDEGTRARNPDTGALVYNNWTRHDWPETDVVIVNYDMLLTFDKQIKAREWDLAVFDEAHMLKTATTIRTMCVFGGKKAAIKKDGKTVTKAIPLSPVRAKRHLYLTGTPILSKPAELWTLLQACDPRGLGRNWLDFVYEFCGAYDDEFGMKYDGASNLDKLNRLLRERFMVRRDKKSVLKDLPPKTRELVLLPSDKLEKPIKKEKSRVEQAFAAFEGMMGLDSDTDFRFIAQIDGLMDRIGSALSNQSGEEPDWNAAIRTLSEPDQIAFTELSEAREEVALAKVGLVTEHVKNLVDCGEPVILFAYHKSVIAELEKRLTKCGFRVGIVTGSVQPNKRQAVVDAFQNGDLDIIIGNILAMGVGFTLTRSSFVVFAELDWVPAMIEQAEDRAWRHGQKNAVTIQHLVVDGSIEAHMITIILEKMLVIFDALDAKEAA